MDFWIMTYGEIIDTLIAYGKNKETVLKEKALMDYKLADLIATNISRLFDKEANTPNLIKAYEFLFKEEKKQQDEIKAKNEMEIWKQRMIAFSDNHNQKWGEKK